MRSLKQVSAKDLASTFNIPLGVAKQIKQKCNRLPSYSWFNKRYWLKNAGTFLEFCDTMIEGFGVEAFSIKAYGEIRLAERADLEGVYVHFSDSLRSGNCYEGTLRFANTLGLDDLNAYYKATDLLQLASGNGKIMSSDIARLRLAISASKRRPYGPQEKVGR